MKAMGRWGGMGLLVLCLAGGGCASMSAMHRAGAPKSRKQITADPRYDFGGFRDAGKWYRGNLHLHTTISDGQLAPAPTAALYRKSGYDFIALTDHIGGFQDKETKEFKPLVYPLAELNQPGFLVIPGMEYNTTREGETIHMIVVGPGYDQRLRDKGDIGEAFQSWWDKGAFTFLAHPHWSLDGTPVLEDLSFLPGIEVFNYSCAEAEGLRGNSEMYWDRLLRKSRPVLGVAVDDCHHAERDSRGGWVMVRARALTAEAVVTALREGRFYASSGPALEDVFCDTAGNLHVRCSPVKVIRAMSTVGKVTQVKAEPKKKLREAVIKWEWTPKRGGALPFVRVEVEDAQGRMAWTQGVLRAAGE